jgi:transcriptional regulator with XRE-family HTH domain
MHWKNSTFADRFKWARAQSKKTQQEIADFVGLSRNAISYWESGDNEAEGRNMELAAECLNVDFVWLDTGVGEPGVYVPRYTDKHESNLSRILVHYFEQADERGKDTILSLAKIEADRIGSSDPFRLSELPPSHGGHADGPKKPKGPGQKKNPKPQKK